jgi:hypothetical protein
VLATDMIALARPERGRSGSDRVARRRRRDTMAGVLEGAAGPAGRTVSTSAKVDLGFGFFLA